LPHISGMNSDDEWPTITETPAGGLFDPAVMEELLAAWQRGLWFWHCGDQMLMYRDLEWKS
jgi:hypothetical protein